MSKNLKSLICCILALLFVSATVIAVFADSKDLVSNDEAVSATDVEETVEDTTVADETTTVADETTTVADETTTVEDETSEVESETDPAPVYRLGDVNFDGRITAADARLALRFSAKLQQPTADEFVVANVILDDVIKANDARLILRVSAQLATEADLGVAA